MCISSFLATGHFCYSEGYKEAPFPLFIGHFWREAGPTKDLTPQCKKWPADGAAALEAPKASPAVLEKRNETGGKLSFFPQKKKRRLKNASKGFELTLKRKLCLEDSDDASLPP